MPASSTGSAGTNAADRMTDEATRLHRSRSARLPLDKVAASPCPLAGQQTDPHAAILDRDRSCLRQQNNRTPRTQYTYAYVNVCNNQLADTSSARAPGLISNEQPAFTRGEEP